ncbi:hypothetical protein BD413DRAFT_169952 [Trametes elegans]|nr:hypothetical protein BD413DRAFT_169952 [Trametes elegans]
MRGMNISGPCANSSRQCPGRSVCFGGETQHKQYDFSRQCAHQPAVVDHAGTRIAAAERRTGGFVSVSVQWCPAWVVRKLNMTGFRLEKHVLSHFDLGSDCVPADDVSRRQVSEVITNNCCTPPNTGGSDGSRYSATGGYSRCGGTPGNPLDVLHRSM